QWTLKDGVPFSATDVNTAAKVCLLGQTVIDNAFGPGVNPVGQIIRFNKIPFTVIGVLNAKGENAFGQDQDDIVLAPYTTVQERITASVYLQNIYASAIDENSTENATAGVLQTLRAAHRLKPGDVDD